ncbi:HTH-type transcriptional regulator ImmR [Candidatus Izimaplasma bacterium HR1]|jgi:transcriptional regulator with XRE-family HTH domain|uniref:helix-turn-helix domain-containing protein n=1 Tax=Candidatus Izimoplasma sp. HR1 TaxID=1541959 RepID=UPI0004F5DC42|nr:HTH-type transcriptional regulator ImmR [Candidatus Izimaplasma bacterium HR1]
MNTIEIGKYIKRKRIEMHLTQKEIAEKLSISFQAVSKWETGSTLPDTSILMELSDILEVTVDQILNAGEFRKRMNKKININEVADAIESILRVKDVLGPNNGIYKTMMQGINQDMEVPFEEFYKKPRNREIFVAKSVIQLIIDGYSVDEETIKEFFKFEDIQAKLVKVQVKYNNQ